MHTPTDTIRSQYRDIWVVGEERGGELKAVTYELLGCARRLAEARGAKAWCVLAGAGIEHMAQPCIRHGADVVLLIDRPELAHFVDHEHAEALAEAIEHYRPEVVLYGATARGRALAPRLAVRVMAGLTADCTGLDIEPGTGSLLQTRPAFGGNIIATITSASHRPQMATVRPRVMTALAEDASRVGQVLRFRPAVGRGGLEGRCRVLQTITGSRDTVRIADARFIVAGGRGLRGKDGFRLLGEFASMVGGAVGASRAAVDCGWIDYAHQVGQTGTTVQPKVYMACGVSGQVQHLVGMQSSDVIIAINTDREAPIMKLADYAVVGDVFSVLPSLMRQMRQG
jgi:electron transfer flavoprotein alpha subunit